MIRFDERDADQPWLAAYRDAPQREATLPVRFVDAAALPSGEAYEAFVARTACVPTRAGSLHDAFNRLVWCRHAALKQRLNALHVAEITARGLGGARGPVRDALTLFDEFGAVWPEPPPVLAHALATRDWRGLFVTHRSRWRDHGFEIVGHALLEQLATAPRKALTAHVVLGVDPLALSADDWARKPFVPLPVLGIPGWWPANEAASFYDDASVFRPPRAAAGRGAPAADGLALHP